MPSIRCSRSGYYSRFNLSSTQASSPPQHDLISTHVSPPSELNLRGFDADLPLPHIPYPFPSEVGLEGRTRKHCGYEVGTTTIVSVVPRLMLSYRRVFPVIGGLRLKQSSLGGIPENGSVRDPLRLCGRGYGVLPKVTASGTCHRDSRRRGREKVDQRYHTCDPHETHTYTP